MADGWLEDRTRIPLAGIVAMVVIVAIVAIFMRAEISKYVFPSSTVEITDAVSADNVRGSASFAGERDIPLAYKERLEGVLTSSDGSLGVHVDVATRTLTLVQGNEREDVVLSRSSDGTSLVGQFEFDAEQMRVRVDVAARSLSIERSGVPMDITLIETISYDGLFTHAGKQFGIRFLPGGPDALITQGAQSTLVPLEHSGDEYMGVWDEPKGEHPVRIDTEELVATIGELW